ncbi:MAG: hypothetical protein JWN48_1365 [Myxococcaceae bacterium]|nr:hypothetical protein [Myxococcaceae bacterium]
MRGVAAIFVMNRHTARFWPDVFFRSYLAVDLFFVLSGFVIALAYEGRLASGALTRGEFLKLRVIRLYPVYFLSFLLATAFALTSVMVKGHGDPRMLYELAASVALGLVFLPFPWARNDDIFPLNNPYWSLFFELLVNVAYVVLRPWLDGARLRWLLLVSLTALVVVTCVHGTADMGWAWSAVDFVGGLVRATFGFSAGIFLFRLKQQGRLPVPRPASGWLALALLSLVLASPSAGRWDLYVDLALIVLAFPLMVLAAASEVPSQRFLAALGSASYPLYLLHKPVGDTIANALPGWPQRLAPWSGLLLTLALVVGSAWLERAIDMPVRRRWAARWLPRRRLG